MVCVSFSTGRTHTLARECTGETACMLHMALGNIREGSQHDGVRVLQHRANVHVSGGGHGWGELGALHVTLYDMHCTGSCEQQGIEIEMMVCVCVCVSFRTLCTFAWVAPRPWLLALRPDHN